jgi:tRNA threonylcarbamoyladenosine modification (KEOPS) complex Cgi121 subunit
MMQALKNIKKGTNISKNLRVLNALTVQTQVGYLFTDYHR